ncbi:isopenicillin N synthase family dioxygenase [Curvivirga sp.]|uniref:isopenicillin N synthase family dioxygenase n=1 Tax=Curvivirga sp. TaxID=2856848 RepID=UPI003B59C07C
MSRDINRELNSHTIAFDEIPIVDLAPLMDGSAPDKVAEEIKFICENIGFLYVKNHGISKILISKAYEQAKQFFDLPFEKKNELNIKYSGKTLRGYIPTYAENVDPEHTRDFKECFDLGVSQEETSPFHGPNLMPDEPSDFIAVFEEYHKAMMALSKKLVGAIALSLDLPMDYFEKFQQNPITIQRLLHYPPQKDTISKDEIGIGAHTDYGFLTILCQDNQGGLEVMNRNGDWISAPPIDDTFIVNIGDLVQTLTNDRYISTVHRVINKGGNHRYSLPFFLDMDFDAVVEVLPNCFSKDNPAKYSPYTCGSHKFKRFKDSYEHLKEA